MPATQNANALSFANDCSTFASLLEQVYLVAQSLQARQTAHAYLTTLAALPTYALNADGTAGTTDGTPNAAHPIAGINVAYNDINSLYSIGVGDLVAFLSGASAPAQNNRIAVAAKFFA